MTSKISTEVRPCATCGDPTVSQRRHRELGRPKLPRRRAGSICMRCAARRYRIKNPRPTTDRRDGSRLKLHTRGDEVIEMHEELGLNWQQIAIRLHVSAKTVERYYYRALKRKRDIERGILT